MPHTPARRARRHLPLAALGLLLLPACSGGTDGSQAAPTTPSCGAAPTPRASAPTFQQPEGEAAERLELRTSCGDVVIELDQDRAPQSTRSLTFLAEQGFYDGTPCHRLTTEGIFVLQCGDPTGTGTGAPGYVVPLERVAVPEDGVYEAGTVAMARMLDPDTGGSQFFIVYEDSPLPPPGYTVMGRVVEGLDIVRGIAERGSDEANGPGDGAPLQPVGVLEAVPVD